MTTHTPKEIELDTGLQLELHKEPSADGSLLLFVHGMGATGDQYKRLLDNLQSGMDAQDGAATLNWSAGHLHCFALDRVIEQIQTRIHLVTHSFGSTILNGIETDGYEHVAKRINSCTLLTPAGLHQQGSLTLSVARELYRVLAAPMEGSRIGHIAASMRGAMEYVHRSGMKPSISLYRELAKGRIDITSAIQHLVKSGCPICIAGAENDPIFPADDLNSIASDMDIDFQLLPGTHVSPVVLGDSVAKATLPRIRGTNR